MYCAATSPGSTPFTRHTLLLKARSDRDAPARLADRSGFGLDKNTNRHGLEKHQLVSRKNNEVTAHFQTQQNPGYAFWRHPGHSALPVSSFFASQPDRLPIPVRPEDPNSIVTAQPTIPLCAPRRRCSSADPSSDSRSLHEPAAALTYLSDLTSKAHRTREPDQMQDKMT